MRGFFAANSRYWLLAVPALVFDLASTTVPAQRAAGTASSSAYEQPLRPQFHWSPRTDYTNDPNGLFYYKGEYHLFYQAREFSDLDTPQWGHAVSTDLVHWMQLPIAIPKVQGVTEDQGYGKRICSGSIVVDWNNTSGFGTKTNPPLVAVYTDPCIDGAKAWQAQSIAYSVDNGRTWTKYAGNPVIDIKARGFRDPKVIWHEPTKRWIAPIAYPDKGVVALYSSANLKEWTHINDFTSGGVECPDLFPMKADNGVTKWVMTVASGSYWVGEFDGMNFTADGGKSPRGKLDYANTSYAFQTFSDAPRGRRLMLAWMRDGLFGRGPRTGPFAALPWQGGYTVVRELALKTIDGRLQLAIEPTPELMKLRRSMYGISGKTIHENSTYSLKTAGTGNQIDIEATIDPGSAARVGLRVLVGAGQQTVVGYDTAANRLYVDRSKSDGFSSGNDMQDEATLPESARGKPIRLRVLVDRSAIEVFAAGGRTMSFFVYPIQTNALTFPAAQSNTILKLSGMKGVTVGENVVLNAGPNGSLGESEVLTVTSIGTASADSSLVAAAASGDTNLKVDNTENIVPGRTLTLNSSRGSEMVTVLRVGTPSAKPTTLLSNTSDGRNVKVASVFGFTEGSTVRIDQGEAMELRTVATGGVGSAGRALILAAPAKPGSTNVKIVSFRGGPNSGRIDIGAPVIIAGQTHLIVGPQNGNGEFVGTAGSDGTGMTLSEAIHVPAANGAAIRYVGSGITLSEPLSRRHAEGTSVQGLGGGLTLSKPLRTAYPAGATVTDSGTGVRVTPPLRHTWEKGTLVSNQPGTGVEFFSYGGEAVIKSVNIWKMHSAWR